MVSPCVILHLLGAKRELEAVSGHLTSESCVFQVPEAKPCSERWGGRTGVSAGRDRSVDRQGELDQLPAATVREAYKHTCVSSTTL